MTKMDSTSNTLYDLYARMGLPLDCVKSKSGFTIHYLKETFKELPFASIGYRPDYFSFLFVKDAHGKYTVDEMTFAIEPGMVYFTNPGNFRTFEWYAINDACVITFDESYLKKYVHHDVFKDFSFLLTEIVQPRVLEPALYDSLETLYRQIHQEHIGESIYKDKIIGGLMVVLLLKVKEYFWHDYNPIYEGNRSSQIVKSFRRNLEDHYRDLVSGKGEMVFRVQDYAAAQNLHPNYLSNVIKTKTGKSISAWIADKTIAEAKSLLQNSTSPIKEIASLLGFTEANHFSNYFKKHSGISPVSYRKEPHPPAS
jgi:AraC family transcriptional regulator, transcriptional activator of pobA